MKIVFMGTPVLAAKTLEAIARAGHEVVAVYTRQRKPVGRKQILTPTPVAEAAERLGIICHEPTTLRNSEEEQRIKELCPDIIVVVAYGRILQNEIIEMPKYGTINLHVSLLPSYRGAAPIQRAIMAGEKVGGVTVMRIDEGIDTGDIISSEQFDIGENETAGDIFSRMEQVGIPLLLKTLCDIEKGDASYTPQDHEKSSHAPPIQKTELVCDFDMSADTIHNLTRGVNPYLMPTISLCDVICGIGETRVSDQTGEIGEILSVKPLTIACGEGAIVLSKLKPQGKNLMDGTAFAAGRRLRVGDKVK